MNWFYRSVQTLHIPKNKRIILLIGGGGKLGKALIDSRPSDVFIINVTKTSMIVGEDIVTYNFDVATEAEKAVRHVAALIDSIDVLINAAFVSHYLPIGSLSKEAFTKEFTLNTFVPIQLAQLCITHFWARHTVEENVGNARKVINISSGASFGKTTRPELASYAGTKAALNIMTEYLHEYTKKYGVTAHIIAPGALKDPSVMSRTIKSIWELQSKAATDFSKEKTYGI